MKIVVGLLFELFLPFVSNLHILAIFPTPSPSHFTLLENFITAIAQAGHNIDVVSKFRLKNQEERYRELSVGGLLPNMTNNMSTEFMLGNLRGRYRTSEFIIHQHGISLCRTIFSSPIMNELKKAKTKYDIVLTELFGTDCFLAFAEHLTIPAINIATSVMLPWGNDRLSNPDNPSYIPVYMTPYLSKMTFNERLDNAICLIFNKLWYSFVRISNNIVIQNYFNKSVSDLYILEHSTNLVFVNSYFSSNQVRPLVPKMKEIGGLHIPASTNTTWKGLQNIFNISSGSAYKGVIYLSMGSMVLSETFPRKSLLAILDAFRELPYQILWKATKEKMPHGFNIPSNIHFQSWLPQAEVLCDPNVKVFVTHGGLLGTQEATYCGVPCFGIPLFADQDLNLIALKANGYALTVDYDKITKESILTSINKLLNNPRFKKNADIAGRRFRDRPISPKDSAVYWIEYIVRHHGAKHLRSAGADLHWYKYHLVDVGAALILGLMIILYISYKSAVLLLKNLGRIIEHIGNLFGLRSILTLFI